MTAVEEIVKEVCDANLADASLKPVLDAQGNVQTTFCNIAAFKVAVSLGYAGFTGVNGQPLMADQMAAVCASRPQEWAPVHLSTAQAAADEAWVLLTHTEVLHGHVATVYPAASVDNKAGHLWIPCGLCARSLCGRRVRARSVNSQV